jgi:hypothetical protein
METAHAPWPFLVGLLGRNQSSSGTPRHPGGILTRPEGSMMRTNLLRTAAIVLAAIIMIGCRTTPASPPIGQGTTAVPAHPDRSARSAIYLHNVALDRTPDDPERRARFDRVTRKLADEGLQVIAEVRPVGTIQKVPQDLERYAQKVAGQVSQLLAAGVPPQQINVIGYSRGATLALLVSTYVKSSSIGYVVIAGCMNDSGAFKQLVPVLMGYAERFDGQFLAITEESDKDFGSCSPYFARATARPVFTEQLAVTGKGHVFAMEPDDSWVRPTVSWFNGRK